MRQGWPKDASTATAIRVLVDLVDLGAEIGLGKNARGGKG